MRVLHMQNREKALKWWSNELKYYYELWRNHMQNGTRPLSPTTIRTNSSRFVMYTRKGWEKTYKQGLTIKEAFDLGNIYKVMCTFPPESYSNRHNTLFSIINFSRFLIQMGQLDEEIIPRLLALKPRRIVPPRKTVLRSDIEINHFYDAIRHKRYISEFSRELDQIIVRMFINTGLRVSELCNLKMSDIDLDTQILSVHLGKGRKNRKVGISKELLEYLNKYILIRAKYISERSYNENEYLFINRRGTKLEANSTSIRIKKLANEAGLDITAHGLRRTFATSNANKGRSLNILQLALGHSDLKTTQAYIMIDEQHVIEAMTGW